MMNGSVRVRFILGRLRFRLALVSVGPSAVLRDDIDQQNGGKGPAQQRQWWLRDKSESTGRRSWRTTLL